MFPDHSVELKLAILVCASIPYFAAFLYCWYSDFCPPKFNQALFIVSLFAASFLVIALVRTGLWQYPAGTFSVQTFISHAMLVAAIVFPGLPLLIFFSCLGLLSWKSDIRYLFFGFSGFAHLFYILNIAMFMIDIDLIKI